MVLDVESVNLEICYAFVFLQYPLTCRTSIFCALRHQFESNDQKLNDYLNQCYNLQGKLYISIQTAFVDN